MVLNPMIGPLVPAFGINLFILDKIRGVSSLGIASSCQPFFILLAVEQTLLALSPPMVTFLPDPFSAQKWFS